MNLVADLSSGIEQLGVKVESSAQIKLLKYLALLHKWNKVYNLTAIREPRQMVSNHLLDSLSVLPYLWPQKWLDVGCGGGLPGVVLAIVRPEWTFTLLDSNSKKTSFVQQVCIDLSLQNLTVHCGRVEEWETTERFDGIISRAFTEVADFVSLTQRLLAEEGRWAAMKGSPERELKQLPVGVVVEKIIQLEVPRLEAARCLVVLKENK